MTFLTQRFLAAARICSGELTIKKRLASAWIEHLDDIDAADLPSCQRPTFDALREAMYERNPLPDESAPEASIRKMSTKQVASYTSLIIAIYAGLEKIQSSPTLAKDKSDESIGSSVVTALDERMGQRLN